MGGIPSLKCHGHVPRIFFASYSILGQSDKPDLPMLAYFPAFIGIARLQKFPGLPGLNDAAHFHASEVNFNS
jgi:hypothetical protein